MPPKVSETLAFDSALPVIAVACSAALMRSSVAMALSVGAAGATVSRMKATAALAGLWLPAMSVTTAVRLFAPSAPRSPTITVKSTCPAAMSAAPSTTFFGTAKGWPPSSSSTVSPATAACSPAAGTATRKTVLCASAAFRRPSTVSLLPCSERTGAAGAVASSENVSAVLAGLVLPAASVTKAARLFGPSAPKSLETTVKST